MPRLITLETSHPSVQLAQSIHSFFCMSLQAVPSHVSYYYSRHDGDAICCPYGIDPKSNCNSCLSMTKANNVHQLSTIYVQLVLTLSVTFQRFYVSCQHIHLRRPSGAAHNPANQSPPRLCTFFHSKLCQLLAVSSL